MIFSLVFSQQLLAATTVMDKCSVKLMAVTREAKIKIEDLATDYAQKMADDTDLARIDERIKEELPKIKDELGQNIASVAGEQIAERYLEELPALEQKLEEFQACGNVQGCLRIKGEKILKWARAVQESIRASINAEDKAKQEILEAAKALATQTVAIEKVGELSGDPGSEALRKEFLAKVEDSFNTSMGVKEFFLKLGMECWENIRVLGNKSLLSNPRRLLNFAKDITTILTLQQVSRLLFIHWGWLHWEPFINSFWVIPNTIIMVYFGWVKAGEQTPDVDKPFTLEGGDPFRALPSLVYGANGFKTEVARRFSAMATVYFAELPIMYLVRTVFDKMLHVSSPGADHAGIMFAQTAVLLGGSQAFFGFKRAVFDTPFFLNVMENLRRGTRLRFERALYKSLKVRGVIDEDRDFHKEIDTGAYKSYYQRTEGLETHYDPYLGALYRQEKVLIPAGEWPIRATNEAFGSLVFFFWLQSVTAIFNHFLK